MSELPVKLAYTDVLVDEPWFVLKGASNWASIEGTKAEWFALAECISVGKNYTDARRVRAVFIQDDLLFDSPRNASNENDIVRISAKFAGELADHIYTVLKLYEQPLEQI